MTKPNYILLLGAGFSRNWGGWLASEVFEYLLGSPLINDAVRELLWRHKDQGFEAALGVLQREADSVKSEPRLQMLLTALSQMFSDMNEGFEKLINFEFSQDRDRQIKTFLARFDAIFTLNQDLLLEHHYIGDHGVLASGARWNSCTSPGLKLMQGAEHATNRFAAKWAPENSFTLQHRSQPYFKLHGSSNWCDESNNGILIVGGVDGDKQNLINRHRLLNWYFENFETYLGKPNTKLMIIGYSFSDNHINNILKNYAKPGGLKLFIIDPLGVDVMNRNRENALIPAKSSELRLFEPYIIGASRRQLTQIFSGDEVEFRKIMLFFK
ncbi:SIR2 family protein [Ferrovibrio sp.]|uniref:SIR2 family protein n=1 Tax=Ferrovibrio sp. TaxID=1917215 RepID=UPI003D289C33